MYQFCATVWSSSCLYQVRLGWRSRPQFLWKLGQEAEAASAQQLDRKVTKKTNCGEFLGSKWFKVFSNNYHPGKQLHGKRYWNTVSNGMIKTDAFHVSHVTPRMGLLLTRDISCCGRNGNQLSGDAMSQVLSGDAQGFFGLTGTRKIGRPVVEQFRHLRSWFLERWQSLNPSLAGSNHLNLRKLSWSVCSSKRFTVYIRLP